MRQRRAASPDRCPAARARAVAPARARRSPAAPAGAGLSTAATASSSVLDLERLDQEVARAGVHGAHGVGDLGAAAHAITGVPGACVRAAARISKPLTSGMRMSVRIRSKRSCCQAGVARDAVQRDNFMTRRAQDAAQAPAQRVFIVAEEDLAHRDPTQVSHGATDLRELFCNSRLHSRCGLHSCELAYDCVFRSFAFPGVASLRVVKRVSWFRLLVGLVRPKSSAMREPAQTLIGEVERVVSDAARRGAVPRPGRWMASAASRRAMGVPPPPGLAAFLAAHDGGLLAPEARLLTLDEARPGTSCGRGRGRPGTRLAGRAVAGRRSRRPPLALDAEEASGDGEWPVVEVERTRRRSGRAPRSCASCTCCAPSWRPAAWPGERGDRAGRDAVPPRPGARRPLARSGRAAGARGPRADEIDATLAAALRAATPPTPALMLAIGMRAASGSAATPRAALRGVQGRDRARAGRRARRRRAAGRGGAGSCWRPSAATARRRAAARARCWARRPRRRPRSGAARRWRRWPRTSGAPASPVGALALRIVAMLEPDDRDLPRAAARRRRSCARAAAAARGARGAGGGAGRRGGARGARGAGDARARASWAPRTRFSPRR